MTALLAAPGDLVVGSTVTLDPMEARHAAVRRLRPGEEVTLLDGEGLVARGGLLGADQVAVTEVRAVPPPPGLTLAVGAGDRERFGWLVEKAAELGVTDLVPLDTERTRDVAGRVRAPHLERFRARARQAIKQSGSAWAPRVHDARTLDELARRPAEETRWLAEPEGHRPALDTAAGALLAAVGPEGGFTEAERELLIGHGFRPVRLGPHVLRFETAALAVAVLAGAAREAHHG